MENAHIARAFRQLADIMELHGENPFKIRSYQNAYLTIRKFPEPLENQTPEDWDQIPGVGQAISAKIGELLASGELSAYRKLADQTPAGVLEMLGIPGLGPKKVRLLWKELGLESVGELAYACGENRLIEVSGFGPKTQKEIEEKIRFYNQTKNKHLWKDARYLAEETISWIKTGWPDSELVMTGELRRMAPVVSEIELMWTLPDLQEWPQTSPWQVEGVEALWLEREGYPRVKVWKAREATQGRIMWISTGSEAYVGHHRMTVARLAPGVSEADFLDANGLPLHDPECRENPEWAKLFDSRVEPLVRPSDIRGIIHAHSTWSDGWNSLEEMARACMDAGYSYLVISDHSRSAFYANGLSVERIILQHEEIDALNDRLGSFRILKGIECDILSQGELDYEDDMLSRFDVVIASIHSQLRMDESKAMKRLLGAIAHPATHILGHMTGRLLLSREGYPVNHRRIIEACAHHGVSIELNANPMRLDMDYTWIPYAMECGVKMAVNPDAHSVKGIEDMTFGLAVARKGGLTPSACLNSLNVDELLAFLHG